MKVAEMSVLSVSRPMYRTSKRALSVSLTGGLLGSTESTGGLPWPPALHATFMPSACVQVDRSQWTPPGEGCETQRCLFLCPPPCLSCTAADGDYVAAYKLPTGRSFLTGYPLFKADAASFVSLVVLEGATGGTAPSVIYSFIYNV